MAVLPTVLNFINYATSSETPVVPDGSTCMIYNGSNQLVDTQTVQNGVAPTTAVVLTAGPAEYSVKFSGSGAPSGTYFFNTSTLYYANNANNLSVSVLPPSLYNATTSTAIASLPVKTTAAYSPVFPAFTSGTINPSAEDDNFGLGVSGTLMVTDSSQFLPGSALVVYSSTSAYAIVLVTAVPSSTELTVTPTFSNASTIPGGSYVTFGNSLTGFDYISQTALQSNGYYARGLLADFGTNFSISSNNIVGGTWFQSDSASSTNAGGGQLTWTSGNGTLSLPGASAFGVTNATSIAPNLNDIADVLVEVTAIIELTLGSVPTTTPTISINGVTSVDTMVISFAPTTSTYTYASGSKVIYSITGSTCIGNGTSIPSSIPVQFGYADSSATSISIPSVVVKVTPFGVFNN